MVTQTLHRNVVRKLRKEAVEIHRQLGQMRNIDPRRGQPMAERLNPTSTKEWGYRVRELMGKWKQEHPHLRIVIKRAHDTTAQNVIDIVKRRVANHNQRYKPKTYQLLPLNAYAISDQLIAMAKTNAIPINEILRLGNIPEPTRRGSEFIRKLQRKHGFSLENLQTAVDLVWDRAHIRAPNLLLAGYRNKKFVFAPLADEY